MNRFEAEELADWFEHNGVEEARPTSGPGGNFETWVIDLYAGGECYFTITEWQRNFDIPDDDPFSGNIFVVE